MGIPNIIASRKFLDIPYVKINLDLIVGISRPYVSVLLMGKISAPNSQATLLDGAQLLRTICPILAQFCLIIAH